MLSSVTEATGLIFLWTVSDQSMRQCFLNWLPLNSCPVSRPHQSLMDIEMRSFIKILKRPLDSSCFGFNNEV